MERSQKRPRGVFQRNRCQNSKKIDLKRTPGDRSRTGDGDCDQLAGHIKRQCITNPQFQGRGKVHFQRHLQRIGVQRPAVYDAVVVRDGRSIGQIELAIHHALSARARVLIGGDRVAVTFNQAAAYIWRPHGLTHTGRQQHVCQGVALIRLDVEQKAIGRVGRQRTLPAIDQISADHCQQKQGH